MPASVCQKALNEGTSDVVERLKGLAAQLNPEALRDKVMENVEKAKENLKELKSIEIQVLNILT